MNRVRIMLAVLLLVAGVLTAAPAQAQSQGQGANSRLNQFINIRTEKTAAVTKGDTVWVTVSLRGKRNLEDLRVTGTIDQAGAALGYPANTGTYSSTYGDADLDRKETDYVAFEVSIPADAAGKTATMTLTFSFSSDGEPFTGTEDVRIPMVEFDGSPFALASDAVTVSAAANGWVELPFAGLAPEVSDFRIAVEEPAGLDIDYPAETHTSLARDAVLEDGETDVARFRLGEAHWTASTSATIRVDYVLAGQAATERFAITISPT